MKPHKKMSVRPCENASPLFLLLQPSLSTPSFSRNVFCASMMQIDTRRQRAEVPPDNEKSRAPGGAGRLWSHQPSNATGVTTLPRHRSGSLPTARSGASTPVNKCASRASKILAGSDYYWVLVEAVFTESRGRAALLPYHTKRPFIPVLCFAEVSSHLASQRPRLCGLSLPVPAPFHSRVQMRYHQRVSSSRNSGLGDLPTKWTTQRRIIGLLVRVAGTK